MSIFDFAKKTEKILVGREITNKYSGFEKIIELYSCSKDCYDKDIIFDFSATKYIDANLSAALGAIFIDIKKRNNKITVTSMDSRIGEILYKNGFMDFFNLGKHHDTYATTVKFIAFDTDGKTSFQTYLDNELFPKVKIPMTTEYRDYLSSNLDEVYQNARQHGNTDKVYACGQWFPKDNILKFTLANMGTTIPENVRTICPKLSDGDAIEWATQEGNTTKKDKNFGGRGLFDLSTFISENKGKFHIISGKGYWGVTDGQKRCKMNYNEPFPGTIINLEINLNDKHIYFKNIMELLNPEEAGLERLLFNRK